MGGGEGRLEWNQTSLNDVLMRDMTISPNKLLYKLPHKVKTTQHSLLSYNRLRGKPQNSNETKVPTGSPVLKFCHRYFDLRPPDHRVYLCGKCQDQTVIKQKGPKVTKPENSRLWHQREGEDSATISKFYNWHGHTSTKYYFDTRGSVTHCMPPKLCCQKMAVTTAYKRSGRLQIFIRWKMRKRGGKISADFSMGWRMTDCRCQQNQCACDQVGLQSGQVWE